MLSDLLSPRFDQCFSSHLSLPKNRRHFAPQNMIYVYDMLISAQLEQCDWYGPKARRYLLFPLLQKKQSLERACPIPAGCSGLSLEFPLSFLGRLPEAAAQTSASKSPCCAVVIMYCCIVHAYVYDHSMPTTDGIQTSQLVRKIQAACFIWH